MNLILIICEVISSSPDPIDRENQTQIVAAYPKDRVEEAQAEAQSLRNRELERHQNSG